MYFGEDGDILGVPDLHNVAQTHSQVFPHSLIHADFGLLEFAIDEGHREGLFVLLALDEDGVALEDPELCHFGLAELDGGVIVVEGFLYLRLTRLTSNLFGAFFCSRIAVDNSFFSYILFKIYACAQGTHRQTHTLLKSPQHR